MMQGMALALQLATIAPFQAGAALQANGIFVKNTIKFTQPKMYSQLLRDSMLEIALLYDCEGERSWLVPKLSLLLHMCHVYMAIREAAIPFLSLAITEILVQWKMRLKITAIWRYMEPEMISFDCEHYSKAYMLIY